MSGQLLDLEAGEVTIKRLADQRVVTFSTELLSAEDRAFLETWDPPEEADAAKTAAEAFPGLDWPRRTKLPRSYDVEVVREDNTAEIYLYQTPNFEFQSDVKLARKVVRQFGKVFEGTLTAMQAFPLDWSLDVGGQRFRARIFGDYADYVASGGLPNSGGIYLPGKREIMLPLSSLGLRKTSSSYTFDGPGERSTLIHEITHQVHHEWLKRLPIWIIEGLAVYMESIPEDDGEFRFDKQSLPDFVRRLNGSEDVSMMDPLHLMALSAWAWSANFKENPGALRGQYLSGFLLFHYFLHLDGDGDGKRMWAYIRAIEAGEPEEAAARLHLIDGREAPEFIESITRAFKRERVNVAIEASP
jgi:hypothetical protein